MKDYQLGLYEKAMPALSWREKLQVAREAGYDFVELSIDASEERIARVYSSAAERIELRHLTEELGISFGTLNASALTRYSLGNEDASLCSRGVEIAERSIELAADLGIRVVMIPGYDVYYGVSTAETSARFVQNIRRLTALAAASGVQLGFETMENEYMNTVEKAMRVVDAIGSNYLQIYPDIGNMTNAAVLYDSDPLADLRLGKGHLVGLHLKETCPGHFREIPYGTGHVDFPAAIRTAWELGVRRYVTEFWYKPGGETPQEVCARFRDLLNQERNG
jgi:L-ribulose-5-phosphate 3-epimerase